MKSGAEGIIDHTESPGLHIYCFCTEGERVLWSQKLCYQSQETIVVHREGFYFFFFILFQINSRVHENGSETTPGAVSYNGICYAIIGSVCEVHKSDIEILRFANDVYVFFTDFTIVSEDARQREKV